jgi:ATP-binding cassette subfamily B protein
MATKTFDFKSTLSSNRFVGLWRILADYRWVYGAAVACLAAATAAKTATFFLIRYLVDDVLVHPDILRLLPLVALGFVGLALMEGAFTFFSGRLASRTAEEIALRLRNYLYDHIQRLSFTYHDRTPTGDLIQRATSDVDAVRRFFAEQAIGVGRIVLLFVVNWIALWTLNGQLALFSVIAVPLIVVMSVFFFRRISKVYEAYQEQDSKLSTTLQENLTGVRVVKAFARQAYEREKFERDNWEKFVRGKRLLILHSFFWPAADVLCNAQMLGGFFVGALMVMNGSLTLGEYLAYMSLMVQLIWPMRELGRLIVQASTGLVSYGRLMEIVREEREPMEEGGSTPPAGSRRLRGEIEFKGVGFEYEAEQRVLKDITFKAQPGQVVALLGPTGSGKTSLVNLLPRFYEYSTGSLTLDGVELKEYPRQFLRQQIGMVEQEPFLFSRTLRENITYGIGRGASDAEVEEAARAAAIHDVILGFPDGYNTLVGEKGITLSGGQKQRVAIARTLLKDPRILILDDSTSSVDTETEAAIREALETLMQGRTTFIIAHRIQSVMAADLILILEGGRITGRGAHEELLAQDGLYRRIYDLQARIEVEVEKEVGGQAETASAKAAATPETEGEEPERVLA